MNNIDPAKMTDAERMAYFASLTKDLIPTTPVRRSLAELVTPWIPALQADRARGLDWKQLAKVMNEDLKIRVTASSLERFVRDAARPARARKRVRKPAGAAAATTAPANGGDSGTTTAKAK